MLFVAALGMGSAAIGVMDGPTAFSSFFQTAMLYLPALWIITGLSVCLVGIAPKLTSLVWVYLGSSFFFGYYGSVADKDIAI